MSIDLNTDVVYKTPDEQKTFGFDFQTEGAVRSGATLSSPAVTSDTGSGLTIGTPVVLSTDFKDGGTGRTIPAAKGVKVKISGGNPGRWGITCSVTESTNSDIIECYGTIAIVDPVT